jgi:uncharacterized membrane protein HdeD (DUF308 family)
MNLPKNLGMMLLGIWLILTGLLSLGVTFPMSHVVLGLLALAAGILLVMGR